MGEGRVLRVSANDTHDASTLDGIMQCTRVFIYKRYYGGLALIVIFDWVATCVEPLLLHSHQCFFCRPFFARVAEEGVRYFGMQGLVFQTFLTLFGRDFDEEFVAGHTLGTQETK